MSKTKCLERKNVVKKKIYCKSHDVSAEKKCCIYTQNALKRRNKNGHPSHSFQIDFKQFSSFQLKFLMNNRFDDVLTQMDCVETSEFQ